MWIVLWRIRCWFLHCSQQGSEAKYILILGWSSMPSWQSRRCLITSLKHYVFHTPLEPELPASLVALAATDVPIELEAALLYRTKHANKELWAIFFFWNCDNLFKPPSPIFFLPDWTYELAPPQRRFDDSYWALWSFSSYYFVSALLATMTLNFIPMTGY